MVEKSIGYRVMLFMPKDTMAVGKFMVTGQVIWLWDLCSLNMLPYFGIND